jgi:hypothetical protein
MLFSETLVHHQIFLSTQIPSQKGTHLSHIMPDVSGKPLNRKSPSEDYFGRNESREARPFLINETNLSPPKAQTPQNDRHIFAY